MTKVGIYVFLSFLPIAARADLNHLPLQFEENLGQADAGIRFLSRGPGYVVALGPDQARFRAGQTPISIRMVGADPAAPGRGESLLAARSNYFRGRDPKAWHTGIPNFERVRFSHVYPGIDLIYYGNNRQLEYDFVVAPGADPALIELSIEGVIRANVDQSGDLVLATNSGEVRQKRPVLFQTIGGTRREVRGGYRILAGNRIGFRAEEYDRSQSLTIDPVLQFSTFYGGQLTENGKAIAVDNQGGLYVAGTATSLDFPVTPGVYQNRVIGNTDVYVVKLNANATQVIYSTLVGGSDDETCAAMGIDPQGNVYVGGTTRSVNFPTTAGAYKEQAIGSRGDTDGFVFKLNGNGSNLVWSTRIGGKAQDSLNGIAVDSSGYVYATGDTVSTDFPVTQNVIQTEMKGSNDAFVTKFKNDGSGLVYSTFLGGDSDSFIVGFESGRRIVVDRAGQVYVAGVTTLRDFPITPGAVQSFHLGQGDVFLTKLNADATSILYSTFLGGEGNDLVNGLFLDAPGTNIYLVGDTSSLRYPTTPQSFQTFFNGSGDVLARDGFITKINASGQLVYSTYLGGRNDDQINGVVADAAGNAFVIGTTSSPDIPTTFDAIQKNIGGGGTGEPFDAFLAYINPLGQQITWASYLGGPRNEQGNAIARDGAGNIYVTGYTQSSGFPLTPGALQRTTGFGTTTSFIARIGEERPGPSQLKILSGDGQRVNQGELVPAVLSVSLRDSFNNPVNGATITFTGTNITLSGSTSITDTLGQAQVRATMGPRPGAATVTASYGNLPPVTFNLVSLRIGPPLPEISANGVYSSGGSSPTVKILSVLSLGTVAGQYLAFPGTNREVGPGDLIDGKLPNNFAGTCVTIAGTTARLLAVSDREIRFQVPEIGVTGQVPVVVITNCGQLGELRSDPQTVEIRASSPEFFYWGPDTNGRMQVEAVNLATGAPIGTPNTVASALLTPARPNMEIAAFGTGFGPTNPSVGSGDYPKIPAPTVEPAVVILDGTELPQENVLYAGLFPDFPGQNKVNFRIPDTVRNGLLTLQIRFGLNQSPIGYIRVTGGLDLDPKISVAPSIIDFGDVIVGTSRDLPVTVANAGTASLTVNAFNIGLPVFTLTPNFGFRLGPGESRVLSIRLAAQTVGPLSTQLNIATDDPLAPLLSVTVSANVVAVPPTPNPLPTLTSLSPQSVQAQGAPFTLVVNGAGFVRGSIVEVDGKARPTFFNHPAQLIATLQAQDIVDPGIRSITVFSPLPGGGRSTPLNLAVQAVNQVGQPLSIINQFDLRFCPLITSFVSVLDSGGSPVRFINNDSLTCSEDGTPLSCSVTQAAVDTPVSLDLLYGVQGLTAVEDQLLLKSAVRNFITRLSDLDRISLVHLEDVPRQQVPFTTEKDRAINALELLRPIPGGNALYDGVVNAAQATQREVGHRQIVVLITPQENLSGILTDVSQAIGTARATGVTFYTVAIGDGANNVNVTGFLRQLARETGGQFFAEASSLNYSGLFGRLATTIQSQYAVTHYASNQNGVTRNLTFTFRIPEGSVTATRAYTPCNP